ncbi:DUF1343 domain-containing protein [Yeosuana marina]|uniref:exo-beta-N-acetylmuramidase NamZ family protein n=1 Tax=Yeosuana marina TaxID=1565536 RepID=UPI0030EDADC2|tara:strand:- start:266 stop:1492 length:1227 start_codon:yes stop_codon:yes gene_type:complete
MIHKKFLKSSFLLPLLFLMSISVSCQKKNKTQKPVLNEHKNIIVGANETEAYLDLLKNKNVAIVANNTSVIFKNDSSKYEHLVDSLLTLHINITKVFAPEHGFRGKADAGEVVTNSIDSKTKLPVYSLYGANEKPSSEVLKNVNMVVFDIQDVGVRFYTYISTLHYVMEACAENGIPVIVLDRPNPNGHYVDGPIVQSDFKSFVGMHPVPIAYGMTIGEYAKMINGEKWLNNGIHCDLTVIPLKNYTHNSTYSLPLRPSPNLPNDKSINLYPSLCLFEGTNVSCGRGTEMQFQIFGSPSLPKDSYKFTFTPEPNFGSKKPKHMGQECYGLDLSKTKNLDHLNFSWLIDAYHATSQKDVFFNKFFNKLAGSEKLKNQIEQGLTMEEIRASWQKDLEAFKTIRKKYLMYP